MSWSASSSGGGGSPGGGGFPGGGSSNGDARPSGEIAFPKLTPGADAPMPPQPFNFSLGALIKDSNLGASLKTVIAGWTARGWKHAAAAGNHYLDATGTPVTYSFPELSRHLPGFRPQFQYWLTQNVRIMLPQLRNVSSDTAKTVYFDTSGTTDQWSGYNANNYNDDFHWTLGHFSIRMKGRMWIGPTDGNGDRPIVLQYRSFMYDIYNFDPTSQFRAYERLANDGGAAEFLEHGQSSTITANSSLKTLNVNNLVVEFR